MRLAIVAAIALTWSCSRRAAEACRAEWESGYGASAIDDCKHAAARTGRADVAGMLAWAQLLSGNSADARATVEQHGDASPQLSLTRAALAARGGDASGLQLLEAAVQRCLHEGDSTCAVRGYLELDLVHMAKARYRDALSAINRAGAEPGLQKNGALNAKLLLRTFDLLYEMGDGEGAERALSAAVALHSLPASDAPYVHTKQGILQAMLGRPALAREAYLAAIAEAKKTGATYVEWTARLNLVKGAAQGGDAAEAAAQLAQAEVIFPKLPKSKRSEAALHYHRALCLRARGAPLDAVRELDLAGALQLDDDWAFELEAEKALALRDAGQNALAERSCAAAMDAVERLREEMGADELKAHLLPARRRPFQLLFELQARAGRTLPALQTAERTLARTFLDAFVQARAPSRDAADAILRAEALQSFLPALRRSPVVTPRPIERVLAGLGDRHALVWFGAADAVWLADVHKSNVSLTAIQAPPAALEALAAAVRRDPGDLRAAAKLGAALLSPAKIQLGEELYLIASDPLAAVPFAALRHGGRALVEDHVLHLAPSLTALAALADPAAPNEGAAAVIADAKGDLAGAREEAAQVSRRLQASPLLGERASRGAVRAAADARVLHLAVHGGVGLQGAFLQLADGDLTSADVLAFRLHPRLVVLSACASAATRAHEAWGSMAASFLAAGSRAVVGSLWSIDDAATRALAERFYDGGGVGRPALALALAQRALLAEAVPARDWAGFVAYGE